MNFFCKISKFNCFRPFNVYFCIKNRKMNIGILREEKVPADKRVPFSPIQCKQIITEFPELKIFVQSSSIRCFTDQEYIEQGISVVNNLDS